MLAGRTYPLIDKANRRKQISEPDGSLWTFDYNQRGEVIRGEKQNAAGNLLDGFRFAYQYDHIGNRITSTTGAPDLVSSYGANSLNEYTQIVTPQTDFVRGTASGAASVTVNGHPVPLDPGESFNARVTSGGQATIVATAPDGSTATETRTVALPPATFVPQYDADGNLLNDGLWTYTWDGENRLIALESTPANPLPQRIFKRFTYDYQSRRVSEERFVFDPVAGTGGAGTYVLEKAIRWVNDGWNQSVELLNDRPIRTYVWGLDLSGTPTGAGGVGGLLSSVDLLAGSGWDYLSDANGNVMGLTNSDHGEIIARYQYGPYGAVTTTEGTAAKLNRVRFSTKMQDLDAETFYFGYRFYGPKIGRWLSRDPIEERGGNNLFAYVSNRSLSKVDPLGLWEGSGGIPVDGEMWGTGGRPKPFWHDVNPETRTPNRWHHSRQEITVYSCECPAGSLGRLAAILLESFTSFNSPMNKNADVEVDSGQAGFDLLGKVGWWSDRINSDRIWVSLQGPTPSADQQAWTNNLHPLIGSRRWGHDPDGKNSIVVWTEAYEAPNGLNAPAVAIGRAKAFEMWAEYLERVADEIIGYCDGWHSAPRTTQDHMTPYSLHSWL